MKFDKKKLLEPQEKRSYAPSPEYLKQYNKCWIAQDDSGRVIGSNKNFDPTALADDIKKKFIKQEFKIAYIDEDGTQKQVK